MSHGDTVISCRPLVLHHQKTSTEDGNTVIPLTVAVVPEAFCTDMLKHIRGHDYKFTDGNIEDKRWMSMGFRSWRVPSLSTPNINEASSKDIAASLHRNVLSWGVWRGQEEKQKRVFPPLRRAIPSGNSPSANGASYVGTSNLLRTASVPDVVGGSLKTAFSSITISAQKVPESGPSLPDRASPSRPSQPLRSLTPPEPFRSRALTPTRCTMRASSSQPDLWGQNAAIVRTKGFRQSFSAADTVAARGPGKRKVQSLEHRHSFTEGDRNKGLLGDSFIPLSSKPSYRSCIHLEVPLRSASSVVFLDKSLSVSLVELKGRRATQPNLHRSTLSVRLGVSSRQRPSTDNKPAKTDEGYGKPKAAVTGGNKRSDRESASGHDRGPLSNRRGHKVEKTATARGVDSRADDAHTHRRGATLGILSFRGPRRSHAEAGRQNGNADEGVCPTRSNFRHRHHAFNMGSVESRTRGRQSQCEKSDAPQGQGCSRGAQSVTAAYEQKMCYYHSRLLADSLDVTHKTLSLKEALELFRPDFISRSQGRVSRLEQRARRRRALQDCSPDPAQYPGEDRGKRSRKCTTPHPLSDNLFKPRERSISGREMQLRSRRIYNKLPEVTKKKEEEKRRAISQTNRLRAELFKKRLLDQILQR